MQARKEINAPFTPEQVKYLKFVQHSDRYHPYRCMGNDGDCGSPENRDLLVREEGYSCPCGRYTQTVSWEHTVEAGKLIERIEQEKTL